MAASIGFGPNPGDPASLLRSLDPATAAGTVGWQVCTNLQTAAVTNVFAAYPGAPAPAISPLQLAQQAAAQLEVTVPAPATSPGLDRFQLVGLRTWLWVTRWDPVTRTATIPGLSATVSARPVRSTWDFGTQGTVTCTGPGTPYDLTKAPADQSTDCALTFTHSGHYLARVSVDWAISWRTNTGAAGTLPDQARTTTFPIEARAAQAVTN